MGVLCLIYLICAIRTNVVLFAILFQLPFAFSFLTAAFWYNAEGKTELAGRMQIAGGSFIFVVDMLGWYLFFALMLAAIDSPIQLPGEISHF
jgi:succinate-acetate transporter protein